MAVVCLSSCQLTKVLIISQGKKALGTLPMRITANLLKAKCEKYSNVSVEQSILAKVGLPRGEKLDLL